MTLRQIAPSRTGDRDGVSVIGFDDTNHPFIAGEVTAARGPGIVAHGKAPSSALPDLDLFQFGLAAPPRSGDGTA